MAGPVCIDRESEEKASLLDVLRAIGSAELLGMEETRDKKHQTYTYIYRPSGLLWRKTPAEMRSSKKVKVIVVFPGPGRRGRLSVTIHRYPSRNNASVSSVTIPRSMHTVGEITPKRSLSFASVTAAFTLVRRLASSRTATPHVLHTIFQSGGHIRLTEPLSQLPPVLGCEALKAAEMSDHPLPGSALGVVVLYQLPVAYLLITRLDQSAPQKHRDILSYTYESRIPLKNKPVNTLHEDLSP
jgi:hypothetical protein